MKLLLISCSSFALRMIKFQLLGWLFRSTDPCCIWRQEMCQYYVLFGIRRGILPKNSLVLICPPVSRNLVKLGFCPCQQTLQGHRVRRCQGLPSRMTELGYARNFVREIQKNWQALHLPSDSFSIWTFIHRLLENSLSCSSLHFLVSSSGWHV
jgi:hypothetical protein